MLLEMKYNGLIVSADCPLHTSLLQFLQQAGGAEQTFDGTFHDGLRCIDPSLELAHRWADKELCQGDLGEHSVEYPALVAEELCPELSAK